MATENCGREVGPQELIYDKEITPLLFQIKEICDKHQISMVSQFALDKVLSDAEEGCVMAAANLVHPDNNPPIEIQFSACLIDLGLEGFLRQLMRQRILIHTPTGLKIRIQSEYTFCKTEKPGEGTTEQAEPGNG